MASIQKLLGKPVLWESVMLSLVCMADAFWTVLAVNKGLALEANPILSYAIAIGPAVFIAIKVLSFVPGIVAAEYLRFSNERFATLAIRTGLAAYIVLYVVGDLRLNHLI